MQNHMFCNYYYTDNYHNNDTECWWRYWGSMFSEGLCAWQVSCRVEFESARYITCQFFRLLVWRLKQEGGGCTLEIVSMCCRGKLHLSPWRRLGKMFQAQNQKNQMETCALMIRVWKDFYEWQLQLHPKVTPKQNVLWKSCCTMLDDVGCTNHNCLPG